MGSQIPTHFLNIGICQYLLRHRLLATPPLRHRRLAIPAALTCHVTTYRLDLPFTTYPPITRHLPSTHPALATSSLLFALCSSPIDHSLHLPPCTLHLPPCTLHPAPSTLHPAPCRRSSLDKVPVDEWLMLLMRIMIMEYNQLLLAKRCTCTCTCTCRCRCTYRQV